MRWPCDPLSLHTGIAGEDAGIVRRHTETLVKREFRYDQPQARQNGARGDSRTTSNVNWDADDPSQTSKPIETEPVLALALPVVDNMTLKVELDLRQMSLI